MPIVQIHMLDGRSVEQKRALVRQVTQAICDTVDVGPETVQIIICDMPHDSYGSAGQLRVDKK